MPEEPNEDRRSTRSVGGDTPAEPPESSTLDSTAPMAFLDNLATDAEQPERIGPFKIVRSIGHGGMGHVFLAEQQEPVRRQVALKLVKAGMDTPEVIARFESERQALALMTHTNIASVYEAGTALLRDGVRPWNSDHELL